MSDQPSKVDFGDLAIANYFTASIRPTAGRLFSVLFIQHFLVSFYIRLGWLGASFYSPRMVRGFAPACIRLR